MTLGQHLICLSLNLVPRQLCQRILRNLLRRVINRNKRWQSLTIFVNKLKRKGNNMACPCKKKGKKKVKKGMGY